MVLVVVVTAQCYGSSGSVCGYISSSDIASSGGGGGACGCSNSTMLW